MALFLPSFCGLYIIRLFRNGWPSCWWSLPPYLRYMLPVRYRRQEIALLGMGRAYVIPFLIGKIGKFLWISFLISSFIQIAGHPVHPFFKEWNALKYYHLFYLGHFPSPVHKQVYQGNIRWLLFGLCSFLLFLISSLLIHISATACWSLRLSS